MGKLKRLRKTVIVDSTDEEFGEFSSSPSPPARRGKNKLKSRGIVSKEKPSQRKSVRRQDQPPPTKKELAMKAELADLLGSEGGGDSSSSGDGDDDSASSMDSLSEGSDSSLSDLEATSDEDGPQESGPTKGAILSLVKVKEKRKNGKRRLSLDSDDNKNGKVTGRLRRKTHKTKTKAIDADMLEEAERGHAIESDDDSSHVSLSANRAGEELVLGDGGIIVPAILGKHLQRHQVDGVKFMHDSCVNDKGCVLAHCMGLGKTLQAVTIISTLLATPVEWEGDEGDPSIERKLVSSSNVTVIKISANKMPVGELRNELKKRGVIVIKLKKKELAKLLEEKWREEEALAELKDKKAKKLKRKSKDKKNGTSEKKKVALDKKCSLDGDQNSLSMTSDKESDDYLELFDDHLTLHDNKKKRRPRTVLVVCPVNVLLNWEAEFDKWLGNRAPLIYSLQAVGSSNAKRARILEEWHETGGIMICGYDQYRNLTAPTRVQKAEHRETFQFCLVSPGPLLLVCDEGHILRNAKSGLACALNRIVCQRRIILTGTPLQNNLLEYHCMIDFIRPGLLGSASSFQRDFVRVMENGQCEDSTASEVQLMKQRAHVLHGLLRVCVHRADLKVLEQYLPPKHEYALKVRMSPLQARLYREYLCSSGLASATTDSVVPQVKLFEAYTHLAKVWTHPGVLKMERSGIDKTAKAREVQAYDSIDDFVCQSSDEHWSDDEQEAVKFDRNAMKGKNRKRKLSTKGRKVKHQVSDSESECISSSDKENKSTEWWEKILKSSTDDIEAPELSGKMLVMLQILKEAAALKAKILLFSQSLLVLELIERVLDAGSGDGHNQRWKLGRDYFRLDGSTSAKTRQGWVERFNDRRNRRARLFLISTKAGGLGVNLSTASRVIIFDAAWNPSVDSQAVFRAFRFGQTQQVFVYRLLAAGTMEEKIYHRQVNKNALASRVVDKEQKDRHFKAQELDNLYEFDPEGVELLENVKGEGRAETTDNTHDDTVGKTSSDSGSDNKVMVRDRIPKFRNCTDALPSDPVLVRLLGKMQPKWLLGYVDHDMLATGEGETELSTEEEAAAWTEYETANKAQEQADDALKGALVKSNEHNGPPSKPGPHTSKSNEHHSSKSTLGSDTLMINKDNGPSSKPGPHIAIKDPVTNSIPKKVRVKSTSSFFNPPSKLGSDALMIKKDNGPSSKSSKRVRVVSNSTDSSQSTLGPDTSVSNKDNGPPSKLKHYFAIKDPVTNSIPKKVMSTSTL